MTDAKAVHNQATTPEEEEKISQIFSEKVSKSKHWKTVYRDRLLPNEDFFDTQRWDKIIKDEPEKAAPYLAFIAIADVYEMLKVFAGSVIEVERAVEKVQLNIELVAKKTDVDLSTIGNDVGELKDVILPKLKGIAELIDRKKLEDERRKRNGDEMVV